MSELGIYLRERFEEIVDPIDIDTLINELQTGERTVTPLPPQRRDRAKSWLVAAAAAAVVLIAGAAWLSLATRGGVAPADQPTTTIAGDAAIGVVERLIDAVNRNDFDTYVSLLGDDKVVLDGRGDGMGCGDRRCEDEERPTADQARQNVRNEMAFNHALGGRWVLNSCRVVATVPSVEGTAVTCDASSQSIEREAFGVPPQDSTLRFRIAPNGDVAWSIFDLSGTSQPGFETWGDLGEPWETFWEWALAQLVEDIESQFGTVDLDTVDLDPATARLIDPCSVTGLWDAPFQSTAECADWVLEQLEMYES